MKRILTLTFAIAMCHGGLATAATIDFTGLGKAKAVTIDGLYSGGVYAGEMNWAWIDGRPSGFEASFSSYCVDILNVETDPETVTVKPVGDLTPSTSPQTVAGAAGRVAWLVDSYAPSIHKSGSDAEAAGLQIAIWEALYDMQGSTFDLGSGLFQLASTGGARDWATTYLTALAAANAGSYMSSTVLWLDASVGQDQVVHQVPEPASWALLVVAIGIALASSRRLRSGSNPA